MQSSAKTKKQDAVTSEEKSDVEEFYKAKANGKTRKSSLEDFLKELHE